jgi:hypothetical protein
MLYSRPSGDRMPYAYVEVQAQSDANASAGKTHSVHRESLNDSNAQSSFEHTRISRCPTNLVVLEAAPLS